ncbi:MAG: hypothetical protein AAFY58_05915, partial [Planctomycetota bacterium]
GRYEPAAFYVASNQSLLSATSLGTKGRNHADTSGSTFSLIGSGVTDTAREQTLTALLGHPAYPDDLAKSDAQQVAPTNPRGSFIVQSAGSDGWYLSAKRAGSFYTGSAGNAQITYASMFFGPGGTDRYENNETRDIMQAFDDLMGTAGN